MKDLIQAIREKKEKLDALRPLSGGALESLRKYYDVELTFTSNAIEGNTLTHRETAEIIEHGITVGGKPLKDHLEALDHYDAVQLMRAMASGGEPIGENAIRKLHASVVARSRPEIAGVYSPYPRRIAGSPVVFPNPVKIPKLMEAFGGKLESAASTPEDAFRAHFELTAIHPFSDGNGRTARLLMNLILLRGGYPPIAVRPEDRKPYLDALESASLTGDLSPFMAIMHERLDETLADYLSALQAPSE